VWISASWARGFRFSPCQHSGSGLQQQPPQYRRAASAAVRLSLVCFVSCGTRFSFYGRTSAARPYTNQLLDLLLIGGGPRRRWLEGAGLAAETEPPLQGGGRASVRVFAVLWQAMLLQRRPVTRCRPSADLSHADLSGLPLSSSEKWTVCKTIGWREEFDNLACGGQAIPSRASQIENDDFQALVP